MWRPHISSAITRSWLLPLALTISGVLLRIFTIQGFPQPMWTPDSTAYLRCASDLLPRAERPCGYGAFLMLLAPFRSVLFVVVVQHALGVGVAVAMYMLLVRRFRVLPVIAGLAIAPILLDADIIGLEHYFLSDALFCYLAVAATVALLWRARCSWKAAALAGLLIGITAEVRSVGMPLVVLFGGYLLIRRCGIRVTAAFAAAAILPIAAYTGWVRSVGGQSAVDGGGIFLWSRVAVFADCAKIRPQGDLARLCPQPTLRLHSSNYIWSRKSPIRVYSHNRPFSPHTEALATKFAVRAITVQPIDYAALVLSQVAMAFEPTSVRPDYGAYRGYWYKFDVLNGHLPGSAYASKPGIRSYDDEPPPPRQKAPFGQIMIDYQRIATTPGPLFGIALLAGLVAAVLRFRSLGVAILLPWSTAVVLLVIPIMVADYDFRYVLPAIPFAFLAAGLGFAPGRPSLLTEREPHRPATLERVGGR